MAFQKKSLLKKFRQPLKYTYKKTAIFLIFANIAVYFLFSFVNLPFSEDSLALSVAGLIKKEFWQPATYMFMHGSLSHLFFNMLALLFFGISVERAIGTKEFLILYFLTGIFSGLFSAGIFYGIGLIQISNGGYPLYWIYQLIGASGAIYGILLSYAVIFPKNRIFIYGLIPVPAPILVLAYAIFEFFSQFLGSSNVAHCTHLAGFGFAFLYFIVRMGVNPIRVWKDACKR